MSSSTLPSLSSASSASSSSISLLSFLSSNQVRSNDASSIPRRFPAVLHHMLEDVERCGDDDIVSWLPCGTCFKIHDPDLFTKIIMPRYFPNGKGVYKSFLRQLSLYEFRRGGWRGTSGIKGSYRHPFFKRNQLGLLTSVIRLENRSRGKSVWSQYGAKEMGTPNTTQVVSSLRKEQPSATSSLLSSRLFRRTNTEQFFLDSLSDDITDEIIKTFSRHLPRKRYSS